MSKPINTPRKNLNYSMDVNQKGRGSSYAETTLIEDVIEANKLIGEHIDSLTRRSTLIQEYLARLHPTLSIRTIRRILSNDIE